MVASGVEMSAGGSGAGDRRSGVRSGGGSACVDEGSYLKILLHVARGLRELWEELSKGIYVPT